MKINSNAKIRLMVMTDISSLETGYKEPDDTQSLVRLLLYSNHFDIEGLIATYTKHWNGIKPEYLEKVIREYGKVRANLVQHSPDFPEEEKLLCVVKSGSPSCGMDSVGDGKDTEGSNWIINALDKPDSRPLWITVWGGVTDLAQALWRSKQNKTEKEFRAFTSKIRVYSIGDQYDTAGPWIRENFPDVFYITSHKAYRGVYKEGEQDLVSTEWVEQNISNGHGALGRTYPVYDGGDLWGEVKGVKEGDTPSFLYLIPNGLGNPENPQWGSWGGRFEGSVNRYYDAQDELDGKTSERGTVYRWRDQYQASFQARMDWCIKPYEEANHEPVAVIDGEASIKINPGEKVKINAKGSYDPDGDKLSYKWWIYKEAGSYQGKFKLSGEHCEEVTIEIPLDAPAGIIHLILSLTDDGKPALTSYRRIIITVEP
jgi:hypothetical protein